ncbi:hypothetical protein EJB05_26237, partial [Eragrostis curvula]
MSGRESNRAAADGGGDRISWLPNEVLHRILSFLPSRDAVQTSVLARCWCYFWKSSRRLSIIHPWTSERVSRSGHQSALAVDRLNRFVNCLLLRRDHVPLDECKLSFDGFTRVDGDQVDEWIRHALSWEVPVLLVHLGTNVHTELRSHRFVSVHLKKLELSEVKFKGSILDFSSCTALEDAGLITIIVVKVPLRVNVVKAPMKAIACNAQPVVAYVQTVAFTIKRDLQWCPMFSNLRTLELRNWNLNIGLQDLLWFLKYTQLLQKLVVKVPKQGDPYHVNRAFVDQIKQSLHLPHLKVVEVSYRRDGHSVCAVARAVEDYKMAGLRPLATI